MSRAIKSAPHSAAASRSGVGSLPDLPADLAYIAKAEIDNILGLVCGCPIHKDSGEVPGEPILREMLYVEWGNGEEAAIAKAIARLEGSSGAVSSTEVKALDRLIRRTLTADFVSPVGDSLPGIMKRYYKKAKKSAAKGLDLVYAEIDKQATAWLGEHHMYWVKGYYDKHLSEALRAHVSAAMSEGLGRQAVGESLRDFFTDYPGVKNQPLSYWRGFAANGMNRTRQFGLVQSWDERGVVELEVLAVMDERTSAICRRLNGEIILVESCIAQRDLLMAADDPEDVKTIAPWPKLSDIKDAGPKQLRDMGIATPPYHYNCRTTLVER